MLTRLSKNSPKTHQISVHHGAFFIPRCFPFNAISPSQFTSLPSHIACQCNHFSSCFHFSLQNLFPSPTYMQCKPLLPSLTRTMNKIMGANKTSFARTIVMPLCTATIIVMIMMTSYVYSAPPPGNWYKIVEKPRRACFSMPSAQHCQNSGFCWWNSAGRYCEVLNQFVDAQYAACKPVLQPGTGRSTSFCVPWSE